MMVLLETKVKTEPATYNGLTIITTDIYLLSWHVFSFQKVMIS
jgi:hypothetical protein